MPALQKFNSLLVPLISCPVETYTLEEVRQKALMLEAEGKKRLEGKRFFDR